MNRFDRITAMLVQLQTRRVVKAQDMADQFGVSLRTVYRDIRSLEEAGVPLAGEAGVGYSLMEGYRLPPVLFTKEEALAMVMAEKMVASLTDNSTKHHYASALYKIKAVLQTKEKDLLERIDGSIQVFNNQAGSDRPLVLQPLLAAIGDQQILEVFYQNQEQKNSQKRLIEPVGVYQHGQHWYLIAYCRLRQAYRTFRTDRISELRKIDESFTMQHPSLSAYLNELSKAQKVEKIIIEINAQVAKYLETTRYSYGFVTEIHKETGIEMTFLAPSVEGFARWLLMFIDQARIVEPISLQERVLELAAAVVEKLSEPEKLLT